MKLLYKLLRFEFILYNRSHHLIRSSIYMLLLTSLVFSIIIPSSIDTSHTRLLSCFCGVIFTSIIVPHYLIKNDVQDGFLETLMSVTTVTKIFTAKYLALVSSLIISIIITLPLTTMFFSHKYEEILYLLALMILTILQISAYIIFTNIIHAYFRRNTNLLISLILPLIIPSLIMGSMGLETLKLDFIMILFGIDMIVIPIIFLLSIYLLKNLYKF